MAAGFRIDQFLTACVTTVVSRLHPHVKTVIDAGGDEVIAAKIREMGVPDKPMTLVDVARHAGILGPDPNVIDVKPVRQNQHKRRARV